MNDVAAPVPAEPGVLADQVSAADMQGWVDSMVDHLAFQFESWRLSLNFVFIDEPYATQLAMGVAAVHAKRGIVWHPRQAQPFLLDHPHEAASDLLASVAHSSVKECGPLWLAATCEAADPAWDDARSQFLARLNERRYLLERDCLQPLVLVFPAAFLARARGIAPDLWHRRDFTIVGVAGETRLMNSMRLPHASAQLGESLDEPDEVAPPSHDAER